MTTCASCGLPIAPGEGVICDARDIHWQAKRCIQLLHLEIEKLRQRPNEGQVNRWAHGNQPANDADCNHTSCEACMWSRGICVWSDGEQNRRTT